MTPTLAQALAQPQSSHVMGLIFSLWLVLMGPVYGFASEYKKMSGQKTAALVVLWPIFLAVFLTLVLLTKTVPALRYLAAGVAEWMPVKHAPSSTDATLEAARREVEQIAPSDE